VLELPAQSLAEHHTVLVQDVVQAAHQAMLERDWDALRLMLHPYLHWTAADGSRLRGRIKILDWLAPPAEPVAVELRDGQIYRWQEPPDD
jgi:hypothetical protein